MANANLNKEGNITITLKKGLIGCNKKQIATAYALGLRRIGDKTVQPCNEPTKGKINRINHLIEVSQG